MHSCIPQVSKSKACTACLLTHALPAGRHGLAPVPARAAELVLLLGGTDSEAAQKARGLDLEHLQTDTGFPKLTFGKVVKILSVVFILSG